MSKVLGYRALGYHVRPPAGPSLLVYTKIMLNSFFQQAPGKLSCSLPGLPPLQSLPPTTLDHTGLLMVLPLL